MTLTKLLNIAYRLLVLKRGKIQYDGIPEEVLCHEMFQHVFGIDVDIFQEVTSLLHRNEFLKGEKSDANRRAYYH